MTRALLLLFLAVSTDHSLDALHVVAARSNGHESRIVVIERSRDDERVVAESLLLLTPLPNVRVIDLDADGRPEVEAWVTGDDRRPSRFSWLFRWTGTALVCLNPALDDEEVPGCERFINAELRDVDGDGVLEVVQKQKVFVLGQERYEAR